MYKFIFTALVILMGVNFAFANPNENTAPQKAVKIPNMQGYTVYVPAGVKCSAILSTEINSQNATIGQTVAAVLIDDFIYNEIMIAPVGSTIVGTVVSNKRAEKNDRTAKTQVRFTTIRTLYNNLIPISATIYTEDLSGVLSGEQVLKEANSQIDVYFEQPITLGAQ